MKIEDIHAFTAFVRLQSTSLTAQHLGITQPAVTRRIQNLEQACAVQLFDRHTRPLKLTAIGREIYGQCCIIEQEFNHLKQLIAQQNNQKNKIRIGIPNSFSDIGLLHILNELKQQFPQIDVELSSGWGRDLLQKLELGQIDGLISSVRDVQHFPTQFPMQIMGTLHVRPIISKKLLQSGVCHLQDVQEIGWILNTEGCGFRQYLTEQLHDQQQELKLKIEVTGAKLQLELVSQGIGVAFMPQEIAQQYENQDRLATLMLPEINLDLLLINAHRADLDYVQAEVFQQVAQYFTSKLQLS